MKGVILEFTAGGFYACDSLAEGIALPLEIMGELRQAGCEQCPRFTVCRMSAWTQVQTSITDLEALKAACAALGLEYRQGTHPQIVLPWVKHFPISVQPDGKTYRFAYDVDLYTHYPETTQKLGENFGRLLQEYGVQKATKYATSKGYLVRRETLTGGNIRLHVTV